jgi:hypothetical protein
MTTQSVFDYFKATLGQKPRCENDVKFLHDTPLDSLCGLDCKRAIDAAKALLDVSDDATGDRHRAMIIDIADDTIQTFIFG